MLQDLYYELRDVYPKYPDILYAFLGQSPNLDKEEVEILLSDKVDAKSVQRVIDTLLWFSFIGIMDVDTKSYYSYQTDYNIERLKRHSGTSGKMSIHPAFRAALECSSE